MLDIDSSLVVNLVLSGIHFAQPFSQSYDANHALMTRPQHAVYG